MTRRLLLVRHGETDWNAAGRFQGHTDVELNEQGRAQARALAERLHGRPITGVVSSDLRRARETAEIVSEHLAVPLVAIDPELRERSYGSFEGLTRDEIALKFPDEWQKHVEGALAEPPGAEPRHVVRARLVRAVTRTLFEHGRPGSDVVVVSHGGAMRAFLEAATDARVPPVPNCAIYELFWDGVRFSAPVLL